MSIAMQLPVPRPLGRTQGGPLHSREIVPRRYTLQRPTSGGFISPLTAAASIHTVVRLPSATSSVHNSRGGCTRAVGSGLHEVVTAVSSAPAAPLTAVAVPVPAIAAAIVVVAVSVALWSFLSGHKREEKKLEAAYNLPPGDLGAPALGETLEYVQDMVRAAGALRGR